MPIFKPPVPRSLRASLALLLTVWAFVASACAPEGADIKPLEIEGKTTPLYLLGTKWPSGKVPVCFADTTNNADLRARAQLLAKESWQAAANITFSGWGACPTSGQYVKISFKAGSNGWSKRGMQASGPTPLTLGTGITDRQFRYEVLHELGHALGFAHEQERPDNWDANNTAIYCDEVDQNLTALPGGTYLTQAYDNDSIMNYCSGWRQTLSAGDIAGAIAAYGGKTWPAGLRRIRAPAEDAAGNQRCLSRVTGSALPLFKICNDKDANQAWAVTLSNANPQVVIANGGEYIAPSAPNSATSPIVLAPLSYYSLWTPANAFPKTGSFTNVVSKQLLRMPTDANGNIDPSYTPIAVANAKLTYSDLFFVE